MADPTKTGDAPDTTSIAYDAMLPLITPCRDVYEGTRRMRAKRKVYLPQHPAETDDAYDARLKQAVLFNAYRRTVGGLVGMVMRKDPILSGEGDQRVKTIWDNVDNAGRSGDLFAKDVFTDAMIDGLTHVLVDMPKQDSRIRTLEDERSSGRRPYWVPILQQNLIGADWERRNGEPTLTRIRYREMAVVPDGKYGQKSVERIRIIEPTSWELWEKVERQKLKEKWKKVDGGTNTLRKIALVTVYTDRESFMVGRPPLLDLADENIGHWQVRTDHRHALHMASIPIPVFVGRIDPSAKVKVGPGHGIDLTVGGSADYLEPDGKALSSSRDELKDIEQRMAALGLAMLVRETRAAETAEAKRLDKAEGDSALATAAVDLERGLNELLSLTGDWLNVSDAPTVTVNRDYQGQQMDAAMAKVLVDMVGADLLSLDTLWRLQVEGEILPDDFDADEERKKIEEEVALRPPPPVITIPGQPQEAQGEGATQDEG